ncbi:Wzz/FepE/Etk N-terminal domain-containing protein [Marivita hallyeonensis]|uniref:Uncharacterized protein involved in exopolysaccharide biosynthesis n=1 Tax=Marivita hallyeonensis TaxID=996342 RepID=A0A1M5UQD8_9RHOB|nr:Wzz/FepE/Etk N-terminal domain-containing protein [Marivita hallyeonensis]SHH65169.1 Uncharacterized protein involved in exopolysaccharide biosynthesis [Marivita hallyeonensis]
MMYFQSFDEVFSALKRRLELIIIITVIGCILSVVVALFQKPTYNAIAVVQIEDPQVSGANTSVGVSTEDRASLDARRTVRLIEQRVMSRGTLLEVMETHDLFNEDPSMTVTERITAMRESVTVSAILSGEAWEPNPSVSGMIIDVNLGDAQKAADVANDMLARVLEEARTRSVDRAQIELEFFNVEEARIREEIVAAEATVANFKSANAESLPVNVSVLQTELTTLNGALLSLRQEALALESNSSRSRPEALERQLSAVQEQIGLIEARMAEVNTLLARAPAVERELVALEREVAQLNEQFTVISRRKADAEMSQSLEEQRQLARFEVLEEAIVPVYPVSRSKRSIAMLGGIASGLVALGVAFLLEVLNPPIRTAAQMERTLGVRPVISVPVLNTTGPSRKKRSGRGLRFALGVFVAVLVGLIAAVVRPIVEMAAQNMAPRDAQ